ncbi:MAG: hypothetical protein AB7J35_06290 [Dehalococcoidia bacterium]
MTRSVFGLVAAFVLFAASFALHIVGGATDQGWLFAIAVGLIFLTATGFPAIALLLSGELFDSISAARTTLILGFLIGSGLTLGALWAANDRSFAAWEFPVAPALVIVVSAVLMALRNRLFSSHGSSATTATS